MIYDYSDFFHQPTDNLSVVSLPENQEWTFEAVTCHRFYLSGWKTAARGTEDLFFGWRQTNHNNNKHSFLCGRKKTKLRFEVCLRDGISLTHRQSPTAQHTSDPEPDCTRLRPGWCCWAGVPTQRHTHKHRRCCCSRWLEINTRSGLWTIRGNM